MVSNLYQWALDHTQSSDVEANLIKWQNIGKEACQLNGWKGNSTTFDGEVQRGKGHRVRDSDPETPALTQGTTATAVLVPGDAVLKAMKMHSLSLQGNQHASGDWYRRREKPLGNSEAWKLPWQAQLSYLLSPSSQWFILLQFLHFLIDKRHF